MSLPYKFGVIYVLLLVLIVNVDAACDHTKCSDCAGDKTHKCVWVIEEDDKAACKEITDAGEYMILTILAPCDTKELIEEAIEEDTDNDNLIGLKPKFDSVDRTSFTREKVNELLETIYGHSLIQSQSHKNLLKKKKRTRTHLDTDIQYPNYLDAGKKLPKDRNFVTLSYENEGRTSKIKTDPEYVLYIYRHKCFAEDVWSTSYKTKEGYEKCLLSHRCLREQGVNCLKLATISDCDKDYEKYDVIRGALSDPTPGLTTEQIKAINTLKATCSDHLHDEIGDSWEIMTSSDTAKLPDTLQGLKDNLLAIKTLWKGFTRTQDHIVFPGPLTTVMDSTKPEKYAADVRIDIVGLFVMANDYLATRVYSVSGKDLAGATASEHKYFIHQYRGPVRDDRYRELIIKWANVKDAAPFWEDSDGEARIGYNKYNFVGFRHGCYKRDDRLGYEIRGAPDSELLSFTSSLYNAVISLGLDAPTLILDAWGSFDLKKVVLGQATNRHVDMDIDWITTHLADMAKKATNNDLKDNLNKLANDFKLVGLKKKQSAVDAKLRITLATALKNVCKYKDSAQNFQIAKTLCKDDSYIPFTGETAADQCREVFKGYMARVMQCYGSGLELLRGTAEEQATITLALFTELKNGVEAAFGKIGQNYLIKNIFNLITKPGCHKLNEYMVSKKP